MCVFSFMAEIPCPGIEELSQEEAYSYDVICFRRRAFLFIKIEHLCRTSGKQM